MEERIKQLLVKLQDLASNNQRKSVIDLDLMLDYTRVIYADLIELKKNTPVLHVEQLTMQNKETVVPPTTTSNNTTNTPPAIATQPTSSPSDRANGNINASTITNAQTIVSQVEEQDAITQTVDHVKENEGSAIAYEAPHINITNTDIEESTNEIIEEKPEPPSQEPEIIFVDANNNSQAKDIRSVIGINDKFLFLNELFNNHKSDYESTLDQINKMKSMDEAAAWLKKQSESKSVWDEENKAVQELTGVLKKHFSDFR